MLAIGSEKLAQDHSPRKIPVSERRTRNSDWGTVLSATELLWPPHAEDANIKMIQSFVRE